MYCCYVYLIEIWEKCIMQIKILGLYEIMWVDSKYSPIAVLIMDNI